jgi:hypothetical protein
MGLDIYVGSLTRYYAGDRETVIQKYARETGTPLQVLRPNQTEEEIADNETIRADVIQWRSGLSESFKEPANWSHEGAEKNSPLEVCARFGFAIMRDMAASAVEHKLVMKLDY